MGIRFQLLLGSSELGMSYNNLIFYRRMPLQLVQQEPRTEFDVGRTCDSSMTHMFKICVFGNSGYCQILHQLMQTDLCLDN